MKHRKCVMSQMLHKGKKLSLDLPNCQEAKNERQLGAASAIEVERDPHMSSAKHTLRAYVNEFVTLRRHSTSTSTWSGAEQVTFEKGKAKRMSSFQRRVRPISKTLDRVEISSYPCRRRRASSPGRRSTHRHRTSPRSTGTRHRRAVSGAF